MPDSGDVASPDRASVGPSQMSAGCLVVGVGASAGGLEAFQRFLKHLPPHRRIAVVYVQHLDPNHESVLPELLARVAQIPVEVVHDDMRVEPAHVYVIPPNTSLTVRGGVLHLGPRMAEADFGKPIDGFLASLAEDQGPHAVGIVLSGTGSDGTAGLRAIREHGGLTIAQLPESAAYDGMPGSAISAGLADLILSPDDMPARLAQHVVLLKSTGEQAAATATALEDAVPEICEILHRATGHDFSAYKRNTLVRRVGRRMDALEATSADEYLQRLRQDSGEPKRLMEEMLIGVTAFFRDPESFAALAQSIVPGLFKGKTERDQVRLWVVGCASGEEVYSLAILLAEEMARATAAPPKVQVFATDLDEESLQVARQGRYPESVTNALSPERRERFFTREDGEYRVRKELRQMCVFSVHNLLHDPPFPDLDLVSCRNLLIYMDNRIQGKVIALFHRALRPGGTLFLGPAEHTAGRTDLFEAVEQGHRIYRRRESVGRMPVDFPLTAGPVREPLGIVRPSGSPLASEAALQRSLERAMLEEYVPAGMVVREDGDIVYLFGPTAKYLGPSAGAPTLNAFALVRKNLRTDVRRALQKAVQAREQVVVEGGLAADGGEQARTNVIIRPFTEADPERGLYVVVFQDVAPTTAAPAGTQPPVEEATARRLQYELRDTREQLQATIDQLEAANQEMQSANEELLSMNEELQSANEELQSSKEEVQTINGELESVNHELTRKVEELDTTKSDLESLFEGAQVATIFIDNGLLIKRFTPTATEVFRLRPGDVGRPVTDITARFADGDVETAIREVLRTLQRREVTVFRPDDGTRYLMRILPYRTRQNVIDGVVITFMDVTDLKRAQDDLERANDDLESRVAERTAALQDANRRKDEFLATLAHELRNPLAAIASGIHLWQSPGNVAEPQMARAREVAHRQIHHMSHLLDDLLDTARIVRGTIDLNREPLDLGGILRDVVDASAATSERRQEISVKVPPEPLVVQGDRDRLQQVFGNLLNNARKYTRAGGHIAITADATESQVVVRVRDDGVGMSADLLPHVFESFVQGRRGPDRSEGGLGLGLTLVRHLVTLHGGSVDARSTEGTGSEFIVRLPRALGTPAPAAPAAAAPAATADGPAPASGKRVLVVDDNADAAELLALLLKLEGHEVMVVRDGPTAVRTVSEFRPDVVLLDLGLPGMDGYEVARQLRQNPELADVVLVAVTGYGADEDRQRSQDAGINHHLVKPVDIVSIKQLLRGIPARHRH